MKLKYETLALIFTIVSIITMLICLHSALTVWNWMMIVTLVYIDLWLIILINAVTNNEEDEI